MVAKTVAEHSEFVLKTEEFTAAIRWVSKAFDSTVESLLRVSKINDNTLLLLGQSSSATVQRSALIRCQNLEGMNKPLDFPSGKITKSAGQFVDDTILFSVDADDNGEAHVAHVSSGVSLLEVELSSVHPRLASHDKNAMRLVGVYNATLLEAFLKRLANIANAETVNAATRPTDRIFLEREPNNTLLYGRATDSFIAHQTTINAENILPDETAPVSVVLLSTTVRQLSARHEENVTVSVYADDKSVLFEYSDGLTYYTQTANSPTPFPFSKILSKVEDAKSFFTTSTETFSDSISRWLNWIAGSATNSLSLYVSTDPAQPLLTLRSEPGEDWQTTLLVDDGADTLGEGVTLHIPVSTSSKLKSLFNDEKVRIRFNMPEGEALQEILNADRTLYPQLIGQYLPFRVENLGENGKAREHEITVATANTMLIGRQ